MHFNCRRPFAGLIGKNKRNGNTQHGNDEQQGESGFSHGSFLSAFQLIP
jgi:hypothetical protein